MTRQLGLFGDSLNLTPVEERVERVLEKHPEARGSDKELILQVWLEEDGLADVLSDDALRERFRQWFTSQATFSESIARTRRKIQSDGRYLPSGEAQSRRAARQEAWRQHFRH